MPAHHSSTAVLSWYLELGWNADARGSSKTRSLNAFAHRDLGGLDEPAFGSRGRFALMDMDDDGDWSDEAPGSSSLHGTHADSGDSDTDMFSDGLDTRFKAHSGDTKRLLALFGSGRAQARSRLRLWAVETGRDAGGAANPWSVLPPEAVSPQASAEPRCDSDQLDEVCV